MERLAGVPRKPGEVGSLAAKRKTGRDIGRSTKEVEGRWGNGQQQQHGRQEEILAGVSRRPREGGRLAVTWQVSGDIGRSTKEVEGRW